MILDTAYVHGGDIYSRPIRLDFSANVNPFGAPEAVKAAVRSAAADLSAYPDPCCGLSFFLLKKSREISGTVTEADVAWVGAAGAGEAFSIGEVPAGDEPDATFRGRKKKAGSDACPGCWPGEA